MNLRSFKIASILIIPLLGLTACASEEPATPDQNIVYTDNNFDLLTQDIETVICEVKGQTVMEKEDVNSFYNLTKRLESYNGKREEEVGKVIERLNGIAASWSAATGIDLGQENGKMLTELCEKMEQR